MLRNSSLSLSILFGSLVASTPLTSTALGAADFTYVWTLPSPQGNPLYGLAWESNSVGYAVGMLGACVRTTDGGATWSAVSDLNDLAENLNDLIVVAPGQLLAVGTSPGIFRSNDGGASWSAVANPSTQELRDIEVVTGATLCAIGNNGQVLRSTDTGATWSMGTSAGAKPLHEQLWLSLSDGIVVGDQLARRTTNAGVSFQPLPGVPDSDFFSDVFSTSATNMYAMADFHYGRTTNGGASWDWVFTPTEPLYPGHSVVYSPTRRLVGTDIEGATIWETTNDGEDWTFRFGCSAGGFTEFLRRDDGVLCAVTDGGDLYRSFDEGLHWENATHSPAQDEVRVPISTLAILPNGRAYAGSTPSSASGPHWHRSDDGGFTWYDPPTNPSIFAVYDLEFWDSDHGLACGDVNQISRTTDGGLSWSDVALPNTIQNGVRPYEFSLPAPGIAFCATTGTQGALVFRTTDFGATWEQRSTGIPVSTPWLGTVQFLDTQNGYAGGGSTNLPRMWRTTNGGASWTSQSTSGIANFLYDVHWFDSQTGLATTNSGGGIYRTTNGGTSWTLVRSGSARRFEFRDANVGFSTDGSFSDGTLAYTEDGGATWQTLNLPFPYTADSIEPQADGFFVGAGNNSIMRAYSLNPTAVESPVADPLETGFISRLAPRLDVVPAVGSAFRLSLHAERTATLSIHDLTGRELRRWSLAPGAAQPLTWDGRLDSGEFAPAGVYFARALSGGVSTARKLTIVR